MGDMENQKVTNQKDRYTKEEVSKILKIDLAELDEFASEGILQYADQAKTEIDAQNFERLKTANSLKREMGVNIAGIDIILNMKDRMASMQNEFNHLITNVRDRMGKEIDSDLEEIQKRLKKS